MAKKTFILTGIKELDRNLKKLEAKTSKKILRTELRRAGKELQKAVKSAAPTDKNKALKKVKVKAGKRSQKQVSFEVLIDVPYAINVEFGTEFQDGQGFMRSTLDSKKAKLLKDIESGVLDGLLKAVKGLKT